MPSSPRVVSIGVIAVSMLVAAAVVTAEPPSEEGFARIFNGKDLSGWFYGTKKGKENKVGEGYQVNADEGTVYCTAKDGGNLFTEKQYANFVVRFEFKLTPGANNGLAIRSPREGAIAYEGIEIQVLDDTAEKYAKLRPEQYHGSVYNLVAAKRGSLKPVGEWNEEEVTADGRHIVVKLNGATIVDTNLDDVTDEAKLKKHPGLKRTTGHIGFLGHGTDVAFRNIRVKELPSDGSAAAPK